jgi:lysophospholipase L1-like esterase
VSAPCFVAIGDSFTAGSEPGAPPFPDLVAAQLSGWRYANLAVPGARAEEVRRDQLSPALALRPQLVSVICGANDVVRSIRPDVDGFAAHFDAILRPLRLALPDASIVTATYPMVAEFLPLRPRTRVRVTSGLREVNGIVRETARRHAAVCLDLVDHPGRDDRGNYAADGFHPSAAGHRKAALAFTACLREEIAA